MEVQRIVGAILRSWWVILAFVLVSTGLGLIYSYRQQPVYETSARLVLYPGLGLYEGYNRLYVIDMLGGRSSLATTYGNLLRSQYLVEKAAGSLGVPPELVGDYQISCVPLPDSLVLVLQIEGPSPDLVADLANAISREGVAYLGSLYEMFELRLLDPASTPSDPISPDHPRNAVLGVVIGLMGGVAFSILRQTLLDIWKTSRLPPSPAPSPSPLSPSRLPGGYEQPSAGSAGQAE
ncbi:MAG: hypothetical protein HC884_17465 [Chloroflexaceae bacterium]|nr:hypothetical protein [Chloroflexaceae bacterium]